MSKLVDEIGAASMKEAVDAFRIGDTVDVHVRIVEGDKERVQVFTGTVIARRGGGPNAAFTVRRVVEGEGVERVFPLHSPRVEKVLVKKTGKVRRAKLHFLRARTGKGTKLAERRTARAKPEAGPLASGSAGARLEAGPATGPDEESAGEGEAPQEEAPEGASEE